MSNYQESSNFNTNVYKKLKEDLDKLGINDEKSLEELTLRLLKQYVLEKNQPKSMTSEELNDLFKDDSFWDN